MEENFAEQIVPGTFIRVQAEALIAPKGVASGNVGIVGTAANAPESTAVGTTQLFSSLEDARKAFAPSDALTDGNLNLMRGLEILFRNGASTVYAHGLAQGATKANFTTAVDELLKEEINLLIAPEMTTSDATTILKAAVGSAESNGRDVIAVVGSDATTMTTIKAHVKADKRVVLCTPGIEAYDIAAKKDVMLPGNYTAAAVAGLIASLAPQSSPTNKTLPAVGKLSTKYSYGELKELLGANVMPLENRQGIRIVRGITTEGAAFSQVTTRRIVDFAKTGIRNVANPFIGRLNNERVRKSLHGAIDSFLATMLVDEALVAYEHEVKASRQDQIAGRCVVNVMMQPTFSIDYIRVTLALS